MIFSRGAQKMPRMKKLLILLMYLLPLYPAYVYIKNFLYDWKILLPQKVGVKIVGVGNLSFGGSGKTPSVIAVAKYYLACGVKVGILSRGYGRYASNDVLVKSHSWQEVGDEPLLIKNKLPEATVFVSSNKKRGAKKLTDFGVDLIVVDDAFQHRALHRDINILMLNDLSKNKQKIAPYGNLREPLSSAKRASWGLKTSPLGFNCGIKEFLIEQKVTGFFNPKTKSIVSKQDFMKNKGGLNFEILTSIGSPEKFESTVREMKINFLKSNIYSDHHRFKSKDIDDVNVSLDKSTQGLLCTEKDLIRLEEFLDQLKVPVFSVCQEYILSDSVKEELKKLII